MTIIPAYMAIGTCVYRKCNENVSVATVPHRNLPAASAIGIETGAIGIETGAIGTETGAIGTEIIPK